MGIRGEGGDGGGGGEIAQTFYERVSVARSHKARLTILLRVCVASGSPALKERGKRFMERESRRRMVD